MTTTIEQRYSAAYDQYHQAGWRGILPVKPRTKIDGIPRGMTGDNHTYPSYPDLHAWAEERPGWNIVLRLPPTVIGIDVDSYQDKQGGTTLDAAEQLWGALPPTISSTSRGPGQPSRILFFRVPAGTELQGLVKVNGVSNIEIIQRRHRVAVVWPSIHPEGRLYDWYAADGSLLGRVPSPDELPELPERWRAALKKEVSSAAPAEAGEVTAFLGGLRNGQPCTATRDALARSLSDLGKAGSRHDTARDNVLALLRLSEQGHDGVHGALTELRRMFVRSVGADRDGAELEFDKLMYGARGVGLILAEPTPEDEKGCRCREVDPAVERTVEQVLADVDLDAVWARVTSPAYGEAEYTPEWLEKILELEEENHEATIAAVWNHDRPDFGDKEHSYDAALMRLLAGFESVGTEALVEALMCRRLRAGLPKADQANPRRRLGYIARTVARFTVTAEHERGVREQTEERLALMATALPTEPFVPPVAVAPVASTTNGHAPPAAEVLADGSGADDLPAPEELFAYVGRGDIETACLETLAALLIPQGYRDRGVAVHALEARDYGPSQKGRFVLVLPGDFAWPTGESPARYNPPYLSTEWWPRDALDRAPSSRGIGGMQRALEFDCRIPSRRDGAPADWRAVLATLVPLWRADSSGASLEQMAQEWLYGYLMSHHGTGQAAEVMATGRPWVRNPHDWDPAKPPQILVDMAEFLTHCRQQPGSALDRGSRARLVELLKLIKRRPNITVPGGKAKPTWYEIPAKLFDHVQWSAIIEVTEASYERSITGKPVRLASERERGHSIDDNQRGAAR